jgi:hypothetical protein
MYRKVFKLAVMVITILTANLFTNYISDVLIGYRLHFKPLKFTLIGMLVIVVIFYPLFTWLEEWLNNASSKMLKSGKSLAGKYLGLVLVFTICLLILFYLYVKIWYKMNVFELLFNGNIKLYF